MLSTTSASVALTIAVVVGAIGLAWTAATWLVERRSARETTAARRKAADRRREDR